MGCQTKLLEIRYEMADEPVSRILCGKVFESRECTGTRNPAAAIIPLGHASRRDSSSLPEGLSFSAACLPMAGLRHTEGSAFVCTNWRSVSRAGSPLLFGLAPRGVFRAPDVATGAVGSYPTFSPLPNDACISKTSHRFPCAMPPCSAPPAVYSLWHFP